MVHALLVPWSAQGHIAPMLHLAHLLSSAGFLTTLAFSSRTHARLLHHPSHPLLRIDTIPDGLPSDPSHTPSIDDILASFPVMQRGLEQLIATFKQGEHPPTCLISDTFCPWTRAVTDKFRIPRVELWSSLATIFCMGFYFPRLVEEGLVPFKGRREETWVTCIPGVPPMRASDYPKEILSETQEVVDRTRKRTADSYGKAREADRVLVNSVYELESSAFDALQADQVRAYAVGPLFLQNSNKAEAELSLTAARASMYKEDHTCIQWLDGKSAQSTLYVAFGSESRMSKNDIQELAMGLEASEQNFLWVIRPGSVVGESSTSLVSELLSDGFQERTQERGLIVSWAPQTAVLNHSAVGGFLSHCGWNSTLETLWFGVPIIAWPQRADQSINKKFVDEDWQVGIAVERDEGGTVGRAAVEKAIRTLMQGEQGIHSRRKVLEVREVMVKATQHGGSSNINLETFLDDLRSRSRLPKSIQE